MACVREMTRQLKIADLLYFKGKTKNNHIILETDKNSKNEYDFNIMVSIIK